MIDDCDSGLTSYPLDLEVGEAGMGQNPEVAEEMVDSPTVAAEDYESVEVAVCEGGIQRQLKVGQVFVNGRNLAGDRVHLFESTGGGRIEVADDQVHPEPDRQRVVEPGICGYHPEIHWEFLMGADRYRVASEHDHGTAGHRPTLGPRIDGGVMLGGVELARMVCPPTDAENGETWTE